MAFFLKRIREKPIHESFVVIDGISKLFDIDVQSVAFFRTKTWIPRPALGIGTCEAITQTPATFGSLSVALTGQLATVWTIVRLTLDFIARHVWQACATRLRLRMSPSPEIPAMFAA